jgi:hypothetical protein
MFSIMLHAVAGQSKIKGILTAGAMLAGMAGVPTAAFARHHGFHVDIVVPTPEVVVPVNPVAVTPVTVAPTQVWIAPVYQTVEEKVWVPEVTTTQIQRVEIPAQYGYQDVVRVDYRGRRYVRREQVLISPATIQDRQVTVVVTPGHFEIQTHQQLVSEGHWQTVCQPATVTVVEPVPARLEIRTPF